MTELKVLNETVDFMGFKLPIIEGGFGESQRVMTTKQIAKIHDMKNGKINELILNNLDEFEEGVDVLEIKAILVMNSQLATDLDYSIDAINASKNIYILSEQGYMALVGLMKSEKAKVIRKETRRTYFIMKKIIQSDVQKMAELVYEIYKGGQNAISSAKQLTEIEIKKATKELTETIEFQKSKVEYHNSVLKPDNIITMTLVAKDLSMSAQKLNNKLHELGLIYKQSKTWLLYSDYEHLVKDSYFDYDVSEYGQLLKPSELGRRLIIEIIKLNSVKEALRNNKF